MSDFYTILSQHSWDDIKQSIYAKTLEDAKEALHKKEFRNLEDFKALISPAAESLLEEMAQISQQLTLNRFGNTVQIYVPLYLSNECQNICTYCGFSLHNKIKRTTLTDAQIIKEAEAIKALGYDHVLLVTGEANKAVGMEYLQHSIRLLKPYFANISIEVQPLEQEEYELLIAEGLYAVLVYQETYHEEKYKTHHTKGRKSNYEYRIDTPERLGRAGIHKIGLGCLIGLEDWRTDSLYTAMHLDYLEKKYWQTRYSISFPRLRPAEGILEPKSVMTDKQLVQLICAYRIFKEDIELSISTRENASFRNNIFRLGITSMSAGSKTNPGGYAVFPEKESLEQFEIDDKRSAKEIAEMLKLNGYEAVWKDWDKSLMQPKFTSS